ncbi:MAG: Cas10/Cmr2 second palm domain-containing protein [Candidatus Jordarchaeum sp.]|uniref:Cas10/Cmr2 second palm domain-containing protein n=1 Tax=Candidatus Jordarchaeum sp. TaxID=2823881 RepID=UPI00404B2552
MTSPLFLVDPITFKITKTEDPNVWENCTCKFLDRVKQNVEKQITGKNTIDRLTILNNEMVKLLDSEDCEWSKIPSDTRFPGFFSSMSDHSLATSAVGVAIAAELWNKKVDLASEYGDSELAELLKSRKGVIEVVRTLCLLHDSGKPSYDHEEGTRKAVEDLLSRIGFGKLASDLAISASRHHYGKDSKNPPKTRVEWIVAYADKVAVQDRVFAGKIIDVAVQPLRWLGGHVDAGNRQKIFQLVDFFERYDEKVGEKNKDEELKEIKKIFPLDYKCLRDLDSELLNVKERLGEDVHLALILFEGAGIQGYVTKSSSARHLVGRGSLVELATRLVAKKLEEILAPESIIYVASGSMFAIVPPSELTQIVELLNKSFGEIVKGGISLKGCKSPDEVSFNLFELKTGPKFTWINWEKEKSLSRIERRNFGEFYTILNNIISVLDVAAVKKSDLAVSADEICPICFEEKSLPKDDPSVLDVMKYLPADEKEEYRAGNICLNVDRHRNNLKNLEKFLIIEFNKGRASVYLPEKEHPDDVKNSPIYEIIRMVSSILDEKLNTKYRELTEGFSGSVSFRKVASWDLLGFQSEYALKGEEVPEEGELGGSDVAFIKGDGDNFGLIKSAMNSLTLYRKVSKIFKEVIQKSIAEALSEVIIHQLKLYSEKYRSDITSENLKLPSKLHLPFDMVYFGGDDFFLVLDAGFIFTFLQAFRNAILDVLGKRKQSYDKQEDENLSIFPLGVSLGVVVAPSKAPIHGTISALNALEHNSKKFSKYKQKVEDGKVVFGGEISVALERFTTIPSEESVNEIYEPKDFGKMTRIHITSWPLLGEGIFSDSSTKEDTLSFVKLMKKLLEEYGIRSNSVAEFFRFETLNEKEIKLRIKFKAARLDKRRPEREGYNLLANNLTIKEDDLIKFRHRDIANAMKIIKDNPLLLPKELDRG